MISVHFQGKAFNITVTQVYTPTINAEEDEVEWLYEDLQNVLELTLKKKKKKDVPFIIGDWIAKLGRQKIHGGAGKFGLGVQNKAGQRLTEFHQENTLLTANTLLQEHKQQLYTGTSFIWAIPKSDWIYSSQQKMEKLYTVSKNRPWLRSWTPYCKI